MSATVGSLVSATVGSLVSVTVGSLVSATVGSLVSATVGSLVSATVGSLAIVCRFSEEKVYFVQQIDKNINLVSFQNKKKMYLPPALRNVNSVVTGK